MNPAFGSVAPFDADNCDVYSGAHAVVFLFDACSTSSWAYVRRLLPRVPADLCVMILANFRDITGSQRVDMREAAAEVDALSLKRSKVGGGKTPSSKVHLFETSLFDCFGRSPLKRALVFCRNEIHSLTCIYRPEDSV